MEVPMNGDTTARHNLLRPQGHVVRASARPYFDEDLAVIAKMNEMLSFARAEHISGGRGG
jgi:hypothetical protein